MGNFKIEPLVQSKSVSYVTLTAKKIELLNPRILSAKFDLLTKNFVQPYNEKITIRIPLTGEQLDIVNSKIDYAAYLIPIYLKAGRAVLMGHHSHADAVEAFAGEVETGKTDKIWKGWTVEDRQSGSYPQYLFMKISKDDKPILMLLNCLAFKQAYVKRAAIEFRENPGNIPRNAAADFVSGLIAEAKAQAEKMEEPFGNAMQDLKSLKKYLNRKGFELKFDF